MRLRSLGLAAFIWLLVTPAFAAETGVHATLRLTSGAAQYKQGETIRLQLIFSLDHPEEFQLSDEPPERWSAEVTEEFLVAPRRGAVDPLAKYERPFLANERRYSPYQGFESMGPSPVTVSPTVISFSLNDWLRFTKPGHYKLSVRSTRLTRLPNIRLTIETNPVEFDIVRADAVTAARDLARSYRGNFYPYDRQGLLALLGSPNRKASLEEMQHLFRDRDYAVTPGFLNALALVELPPSKATWAEVSKRLPVLNDRLGKLLVTKRGEARVTSTQTCLSSIMGRPLKQAELVQLTGIFNQLRPEEQTGWLRDGWPHVRDAVWLPVIEALALREVNLERQGRADLEPSVVVTKLSLQRWYELDPNSARPVILREIVSPRPRFGADTLGILPDKLLPDEQFTIARNLIALHNWAEMTPTAANWRQYLHRYDSLAGYQNLAANLTSLLARYAGSEVSSLVVPELITRMPEWNSTAQGNALEFLKKIGADSRQGRR